MHKSRLCYITIDVNNHQKGIDFWSAALGAKRSDNKTWEGSVYRRLQIPHEQIQILLQLVSENKSSKSRVHLDIEADDIDAEAARLEALGASRVDSKDENGFKWHIMTDPFGNEFCILNPEFPKALETNGNNWN